MDLKNGKTEGVDEVIAEMIEYSGDYTLDPLR